MLPPQDPEMRYIKLLNYSFFIKLEYFSVKFMIITLKESRHCENRPHIQNLLQQNIHIPPAYYSQGS